MNNWIVFIILTVFAFLYLLMKGIERNETFCIFTVIMMVILSAVAGSLLTGFFYLLILLK